MVAQLDRTRQPPHREEHTTSCFDGSRYASHASALAPAESPSLTRTDICWTTSSLHRTKHKVSCLSIARRGSRPERQLGSAAAKRRTPSRQLRLCWGHLQPHKWQRRTARCQVLLCSLRLRIPRHVRCSLTMPALGLDTLAGLVPRADNLTSLPSEPPFRVVCAWPVGTLPAQRCCPY